LFAFGANKTVEGLKPTGSRSRTFAMFVECCKAEYPSLSPHRDRWTQLMDGLRRADAGADRRPEPSVPENPYQPSSSPSRFITRIISDDVPQWGFMDRSVAPPNDRDAFDAELVKQSDDVFGKLPVTEGTRHDGLAPWPPVSMTSR
jgi:hypothetical protein